MTISRRYFLKSGGIAMLGMASLPSFLQRAVAATVSPNKKKMVVLFQRGAMDGLNVVVPFAEPNYYQMRPTIAIPQPQQGGAEAALDLDGFFGLHPSLQPLLPLFQKDELAIVQAVGSPDPTRSHFDAQDFMESGTPGVKSTEDGWLNRALQGDAGGSSFALSRRCVRPLSSSHLAGQRVRRGDSRPEAVQDEWPAGDRRGRLRSHVCADRRSGHARRWPRNIRSDRPAQENQSRPVRARKWRRNIPRAASAKA